MDLLEFLTIFYKEYQDISWTLILESTARPFSVVQINLVVLIFEISSSITVLNYVSYDFCFYASFDGSCDIPWLYLNLATCPSPQLLIKGQQTI